MRKKINKNKASPPTPLQGEMRIVEPHPQPLSEREGSSMLSISMGLTVNIYLIYSIS